MISVGLRWSNIGDNDLGISFQTVLLVLIFDVIVFTCLAVYFDAVSTTGSYFLVWLEILLRLYSASIFHSHRVVSCCKKDTSVNNL